VRTSKVGHNFVESECHLDATSVLRMRLLHAVAFSMKLPWLAQTKVITSKKKTHAVNAR
jgi:hypothetical protein